MSFIIFIILAVTAFVIAITCSLLALKRHKGSKIFTPFNVFVVGVFISALFMFIPMYYALFRDDIFSITKTLLLSLHNVIRMFVIDIDYFFVTDSIAEAVAWVRPIYHVLAAVLYVIAPLLTFGFIMSMFKNMSAYFAYITSYFKKAYIFSELNEKSITLARDIRKNHPRAAIVFTDVFEQNEEGSYELIEKAKKLGSINFKKDILAVDFRFHSKNKSIYFFVLGENENENLNQALQLVDVYGKKPNTNLYLFSNRVESELLLTHVEKGGMKVRRVNEARSLINRLLYDEGKKLFDNAVVTEDGTKLISAVVVGMGEHGTEMVKALSWFCQMVGYRVEITVFDKDPLAEDRFTALCPELMSPKYNGVYVEGESQYKITVHSGVNVDTSTFADQIYSLPNTTYVFVALGEDEINITTAVNLRMYFERIKSKPDIYAIVENSYAKRALTGITNYRGQSYGINFIGDIKTSCSESVIIDSELEMKALARHLKWGNEEDFWKYEYNYRSSTASAIHMHVRDALKIPGANKAEEDLTEAEIAVLEPLEHCRWNAYMRSEGYIYSGSPDKSTRNDLGKMHHNLVVFDDLSDEDKLKDRQVGSK